MATINGNKDITNKNILRFTSIYVILYYHCWLLHTSDLLFSHYYVINTLLLSRHAITVAASLSLNNHISWLSLFILLPGAWPLVGHWGHNTATITPLGWFIIRQPRAGHYWNTLGPFLHCLFITFITAHIFTIIIIIYATLITPLRHAIITHCFRYYQHDTAMAMLSAWKRLLATLAANTLSLHCATANIVYISHAVVCCSSALFTALLLACFSARCCRYRLWLYHAVGITFIATPAIRCCFPSYHACQALLRSSRLPRFILFASMPSLRAHILQALAATPLHYLLSAIIVAQHIRFIGATLRRY